MLIIALLVPGRWDWTFGASSRDIEVSYNLLSPPPFFLSFHEKICSLDLGFFTFLHHPPSRHLTPTHTHLSTQPFPQGPERTRGLSLSPFFQASPPSAAKHHIQEERGERNKTDRRKKKITRLISLGAIARIHPHALDISI